MFDLFDLSCSICGARIGDMALHQRFHDAISAIIRLQMHPDITDEEWLARINESPSDEASAALAKFARGS